MELSNLLLDDPRFSTPAARQANSQLFQKILNESYQKFTTKELVERLETNQVPFAEINSRPEVIEDPQIKAMGALMEFDHPVGGRMRQPRPPGRFSETETDIFRCSPELGEHGAEVLTEYGFTEAEIQALSDQGVIVPTAL